MGMYSAQTTKRKGTMSKRSKNRFREDYYDEEDYEEFESKCNWEDRYE